MVIDHITVWGRCLQYIKENLNDQEFKTWFEPIKPIKLFNESLTIQVPNKFFYEWIEENYVSLLKKTVRKEIGEKGRLEYQILLDNHKEAGQRKSNGDKVWMQGDEIKNPFVIPGIKKMKVDPQLSDQYKFENFIEGSCNQLARAAGKAIAVNPGKTAFNPLIIFGNVGLGKTHLAQAIGNDIVDFMNFYQMIDVLIVDDIQFLAGRKKTQEIFFNIFNQLHQDKKQIILTSDRPPKDMKDMQERLISRFKWGLTADIQVPEFETRLAILQVILEKDKIDIPKDVVEFIAFNIKNNVRELEGVLISLVAQATLNQKEIDIYLAKEVVQNFVNKVDKEVTVESIQKMVADHFNVEVDKLRAKTRKRQVVVARQLSMYLAKNHTKSSLKSIGENFGGRDHSTVIYSCKAVQDMMDTDLNFKDTVADLEKKVQLSISTL